MSTLSNARASTPPGPRTPSLLDCVHCGLCLQSCPTYVENGNEADSPRGRLFLMRGLEEGRIGLSADTVRHLELCLGCRACETVCPSGVEYGVHLEDARTRVCREWRGPLRRFVESRVLAPVLTSRTLLRIALLPVALLRRVGLRGLLDGLARAARRVRGPLRLLAVVPSPSFRLGMPRRLSPDDSSSRRRVGLFTGCVQPVLFPETLRAAARILRVSGFTVLVPRGQRCCGALALHAGDVERARRQARRVVRAFGRTDAAEIVVCSAGCSAAMKEYGRLLEGDEAARAFAGRVRDVLEFLDESGFEPGPRRVDDTLAVHDPCHLAHAQGIREAPRRLLAKVRGLSIVPLEEADRCCGSAGSYNLSEPEMADRLLARKVERVRRSGATLLAVANPGCAMQIRLGLGPSVAPHRGRGGASDATPVATLPRVLHPVEVLERTLARPE